MDVRKRTVRMTRVGADVNVIIMSDVLCGIGLSEYVSSVLTSFTILTNSGHGSL